MRRQAREGATLVAVLLCTALAAGCATTDQPRDPNDPFEPANRSFHEFNKALDKHLLKPVSDAYVAVTPERVRASVGNFFTNVAYPGVVLNDFLQGKVHDGIADSSRFVLNSTLGILGLFDVAGETGLPVHEEDFGQTLGVWGAGEGAYLELPLLGPNSVRDAPGLGVGAVTNVLFYVGTTAVTLPLAALKIVDDRSRLETAIKLREESALDSYVFTREAYRQRRRHLIYDGNPPLEEFAPIED